MRATHRNARRILLAVLAGVLAWSGLVAANAAAPDKASSLSWHLLDTGTTNHFRGLAAVSRNVIWLGGYDGQVLRTTDGGTHWQDVSPAKAVDAGLQFRDVSAFDANHAVAMTAGARGKSRIYVTFDGGTTWRRGYKNTDNAAFFDCMSFYDESHGLVMSDPVDGKFRILSTSDGGAHWQVLPDDGMPAALPGEAGFAASGQCLTTSGHDAWFGSGGGPVGRVFHSRDGGLTWTVHNTRIPGGASAGVNGLAFRDTTTGIAVGGDFAAPTLSRNVAAYSSDGARWKPATVDPAGYRSGITFVPGTDATALAVGLTGSDVSYDAGRTWSTFDTGSFDTVSCTADGACFAAGAAGRVAVLSGTAG